MVRADARRDCTRWCGDDARGDAGRTAARPGAGGAARRRRRRRGSSAAWRVLADGARRAAPLRPARRGRARLELRSAARRRAASERELDEAQAYFDALADLEAAAAGGRWTSRGSARALEMLYAPSRAGPDVRVELLTVHKAKGLQFDTVIVPALERRPRPRPASGCCTGSSCRTRRRDELVVAPVAAHRRATPIRCIAWLEAARARKAAAGAAPAAVRRGDARGALAAPVRHVHGARRQDEGRELRAAASARRRSGCCGRRSEPEFAARLATTRRRRRRGGARAVARSAAAPPARRLAAPPQPPTAPRIESRAGARAAAATPTVEFDWATETARHVGTVVHRELQRIARDGAVLPDAADARAAGDAGSDELAELGVPHERRDGGRGARRRARVSARCERRARPLAARRRRTASRATELALTGRVDAEIVARGHRPHVRRRGGRALDRRLQDQQPRGRRPRGVPRSASSERYRPQLERYAQLHAQAGARAGAARTVLPAAGGLARVAGQRDAQSVPLTLELAAARSRRPGPSNSSERSQRRRRGAARREQCPRAGSCGPLPSVKRPSNENGPSLSATRAAQLARGVCRHAADPASSTW
ncbi:MAG: hypothetical protein MZV65_53720 [Chromatiales bacterium]|nr:hypothetical protein [Chromatiales bacterium]